MESDGSGARSVDQTLDDHRQSLTHLGQAIEIILALAARGDDPAMPQERQVMADRGLTLLQFVREGPDVTLAVREHQDHLQTGRITDLLQEHRGPLDLLEPLLRA